MGLQIPVDDALTTLCRDWPHREQPLSSLAILLSEGAFRPSTIVVHGARGTGKTTVVKAVLESKNVAHVFITCRECVTGRHLLERIVIASQNVIAKRLGPEGALSPLGGCENLATLVSHLRALTDQVDDFVLVLDGIDRQREAQPTLLPALARLGSMIPKLCTVLVMTSSPPRLFHQPGIAHVSFPPYTRQQAVQIVSKSPLDIFHDKLPSSDDYDEEVHEEDKAWLWPRFCAAVWDAIAQNSARDLVAYRELCHRLWRPFVDPIVKGDFGTQDFSKLMVAQSRLFQEESMQVDSILPLQQTTRTVSSRNHDLPYHAKWFLIAAYLASFNPAKTDALYFMKATERKRRRKGGAARSGSRGSQTRKTPRHLLDPAAFTLDRLFSILHAILPDEMRTNIDMQTQVATLSNLRLLVRSVGFGGSDALEPGAKWRVGPVVTREYAQSVARNIDFDLIDYVAE